jgi:hypothetical protein
MWTVEWFDDRRNRRLTETSSTSQIVLAHPFGPREQHKARKRKRDIERSLTATSSANQNAIQATETPIEPIQHGIDLDVEVVNQERERQHSPSGRPRFQEDQAQLAKADQADNCHDGPSTESMGNGGSRFFLVKPRTSSNKQVLIPLNSTATLGECLNGRTVLEFPTIYVFPSSVEQLPEDFMLEEDYLKQEGEEQKEFDELIRELDPEILKRLKDDGQAGSRSAPEEEVDSKEILDVLKKDFGAVV